MIPPRWGRRAILEVLDASRRERRERQTRLPGSSRIKTVNTKQVQVRRAAVIDYQNTD